MYSEAEKMLNSITKQLCELMVIIRNMKQIHACDDEVSLGRLTNDFIAKCEKLTCYARDFAVNTYVAPSEILLHNAAEIQEINVSKHGEILEIEIPFLLPKKNHKNTKFICDPLYFVLNKASKNLDLKIEEKAVVCFVHVYSKANKRISPRDYDNVEAKRILDIVALFALKDDGAEFCDIINTMELGETNKTKIYVMPERCYYGWKLDRTK